MVNIIKKNEDRCGEREGGRGKMLFYQREIETRPGWKVKKQNRGLKN